MTNFSRTNKYKWPINILGTLSLPFQEKYHKFNSFTSYFIRRHSCTFDAENSRMSSVWSSLISSMFQVEVKNRLSSIQSIRKMTVDDENSVYVGGLPYDSTEDSIQRAFEIYGTIIAVKALSRYSYSRFASSCILIRDRWASTHVNLTSIHISSQNDYCLSTRVFLL